jgi:hypothetical protein
LFNRTIAYRDKKVVSVFVRFHCAASSPNHYELIRAVFYLHWTGKVSPMQLQLLVKVAG